MISVKKKMRAVALSVAGLAVAGAATFTVLQATGNDTGDGTVQDNLLATDLSKDEYVSYASSDVFYGQVVKKIGENRTDQSGELEQQWEVSVKKAFKGAATGTVVVNTVAYERSDGTTWPGEGGVAVEPNNRYVFAGHYDSENQRYEPYGGETGVRPESGLQAPAKNASNASSTESVEEHWTQAVTNERQGPPDVASPSGDIVVDGAEPTP